MPVLLLLLFLLIPFPSSSSYSSSMLSFSFNLYFPNFFSLCFSPFLIFSVFLLASVLFASSFLCFIIFSSSEFFPLLFFFLLPFYPLLLLLLFPLSSIAFSALSLSSPSHPLPDAPCAQSCCKSQPDPVDVALLDPKESLPDTGRFKGTDLGLQSLASSCLNQMYISQKQVRVKEKQTSRKTREKTSQTC